MQVITVPCSFDNYSYVLICETSGEAAVIDPTEAYPVFAKVKEHNATLTSVLCTHHHNDHVGDIGQLLEWVADLKIYCYHTDEKRIPHANNLVGDGDTIQVGELVGKILHTPGHTLGSICYHFQDSLFTGDTLFGAGCGRLFEGTAEQMYTSLNNRIATFSDETKLFFGHEYTQTNLEFALQVDSQNSDVRARLQALQEQGGVSSPTTVDLEKKTNPFFRCETESIRNYLQQRGQKVQDQQSVFTALRQLRNDF